MNTMQYVNDVLVAIESVRSRLKAAMRKNQHALAYSLSLDLLALFNCLEIETRKVVVEETLEIFNKAA